MTLKLNWEPLEVDCPRATCKAPAGQKCRKGLGSTIHWNEPHRERKRRACERAVLAGMVADMSGELE